MDKLTIEYAIKQHIANGAKVEILNYESDYVGVQYSNANGYYMLNGNIHMTYNGGATGKSVNDFRFCLRPLSDLLKEIEHNGERFVPAKNLFNQYELKFGDNGDFYLDYYSIGETDSPWTGYGIIQQLLEWHFDVFGLIDRGMAVAIEREGE